MRLLSRIIVIVCFFISWENAAVDRCIAANWYVDNEAAGAGTGKTWKDAWRGLADVKWGPQGVKAGDTLFISGGTNSKQYYGTLSVVASGSKGNPITIRPGQNPLHNGKIIFQGNPAGCIQVHSRSHIVLDGNVNGNKNFIFEKAPVKGLHALVDMNTISYVTVRFCEFRIAQLALNMRYASACEVHDCEFSDLRGEAGLCMDGSGGEGPEGPSWWNSNRVHNNRFLADCPSDGSGKASDLLQGTSAISVYNNRFEYRIGPNYGYQHPDACQISGRWVKIYNNHFLNAPNAAISMDYGDPKFDGHYYIFNNVIECTYPSWVGYMKAWDLNIHTPGMTVDDMLFANNTVVGINHIQTIAIHIRHPSIRLTNWRILNNIFYDCGLKGGSVIMIDRGKYKAGKDVIIDYNLISYRSYGSSRLDINGSTYRQPHALVNPPQFVSYFYRSSGNDYRLKRSDTAARDLGIPLAYIFDFDKDGAPRPSGNWDLGACQTR